VQEVVGEVLLDDIALVTTADDKLVHAMARIELHDMPQNRLTADLDHGLGLEVGLLTQPAPSPPARITAFIVLSQISSPILLPIPGGPARS
jgi:hypothetical protein